MKWCMKCRSEVEKSHNKCLSCGGGAFWHNKPPAEEKIREAELTETPAWKLKGVISGEVVGDEIASPAKVSSGAEKENPKKIVNSEKFTSGDIEKIIQAQNRTTHAVRAFVLFLFYQLTAITLAFIVYSFAELQGNQSDDCEPLLRQYGACEPQPILVFLAFAIWVAGVIYSSRVGWREIQKSEI